MQAGAGPMQARRAGEGSAMLAIRPQRGPGSQVRPAPGRIRKIFPLGASVKAP